VVHICGAGKMNASIQQESYRQFEYIHQEIFDVMAATDIVVSRAGANSLCEFVALKKPHILIPLKQGSRGDQVLNAAYFESLGLSTVLSQEGLTGEILLSALNHLNAHFPERKVALEAYHLPDAVEAIWGVMREFALSESN
jgi:UDP-N-acetylglucosamine--N-acetylmuramyl-(pentapeptide) pyrophosphoryl-undecaprenol N-acetylglucosamine transferase